MDDTRQTSILNASFDSVTLSQTVERMVMMVREGRQCYVCTVNVAILMMMRTDPFLQAFVEKAELVVADGQPIVFSSHFLSNPLPERVTGIDLISVLCDRCQHEDIGVYFLGSTSDIVNAVTDRMQRRYPRLKIAGYDNGYFPPSEAEDRAKAIRESGAKIVFVGMGPPRQERFIEEYLSRMGANVAIGVGGSFDVLSGQLRRAPVWAQKWGLEWLFRLGQEPARLWKRYFMTNTLFIGLLLWEFVMRGATGKLKKKTELGVKRD